jgi:hypothetical protein
MNSTSIITFQGHRTSVQHIKEACLFYKYDGVIYNREFLGNQPHEIAVNIECFRDCLCLHHHRLMWWMTQPSAAFIHPDALAAQEAAVYINTKQRRVIHYIMSSWWRQRQSPKHWILTPLCTPHSQNWPYCIQPLWKLKTPHTNYHLTALVILIWI